MSVMLIKAKIKELKYRPGKSIRTNGLIRYRLAEFDINTATASGIIEVNENNTLTYSKWVTPKRTRSYPFARIYDTYSFGGKRVTIIPVIKDEGLGAGKNKSNNDRINFITLSWMNLANIYVILAWYDNAEKMTKFRITSQEFNTDYVNEKIKEISEFQFDAHHWNNRHFQNDFIYVYTKAVKAYNKISKTLSVELHDSNGHEQFLEKITDDSGKVISLEKFANETLSKSKSAAIRETMVRHKHENVSLKLSKPVFEMRNCLGGKYYLTSDEVEIDSKNRKIAILECKNATDSKLPKEADIKDGLFKILLFSQIEKLEIDGKGYDHDVSLKLTGRISSSLILPAKEDDIRYFISSENLTSSDSKLIFMLNEEAILNGYKIIIGNN